MVNQDFDTFRKLQKEHKSDYVSSDRPHEQTANDKDFNNNSETDMAPGLTGRDS